MERLSGHAGKCLPFCLKLKDGGFSGNGEYG
jgi:hypothetical protein